MPRPLGGHWLVWQDMDGCRLLRRSGGRAGAYALIESFGAGAANGVQALDGAVARARRHLPWSITVALRSTTAPGFGVELPEPPAPKKIVDAYLLARREQVFGTDGRTWAVTHDQAVRAGPTVAFAVPVDLLAGLRRAAGAWTRLRVVPAAVWGAKRLIDALPADGWYLHDEADRLTALGFKDGQLHSLAWLPALQGGVLVGMETLLWPWARRLGLGSARDIVLGVAGGDAAGSTAVDLFAPRIGPVAAPLTARGMAL